MNDPYSVLGVDPNASDEQVKKAYRDLARKYHPDNYQNNPLADLAEEKMKEINEAYDTITKSRAGGGQSTYGPGAYQQNTYTGGYQQRQSSYQSGGSLYAQVRQAINQGNLRLADQLLRTAPSQDAEWHFLTGYVAFQKGWLDEATQHFRVACSMNPGNAEYRQALSMMQQGGAGYHPSGYGYNSGCGCDPCTTCMCISCASPCC